MKERTKERNDLNERKKDSTAPTAGLFNCEQIKVLLSDNNT